MQDVVTAAASGVGRAVVGPLVATAETEAVVDVDVIIVTALLRPKEAT